MAIIGGMTDRHESVLTDQLRVLYNREFVETHLTSDSDIEDSITVISSDETELFPAFQYSTDPQTKQIKPDPTIAQVWREAVAPLIERGEVDAWTMATFFTSRFETLGDKCFAEVLASHPDDELAARAMDLLELTLASASESSAI
jgi:hypothetical protein